MSCLNMQIYPQIWWHGIKGLTSLMYFISNLFGKFFFPFEIQSQRQVRSSKVIKHHNPRQVYYYSVTSTILPHYPLFSEKTLFSFPLAWDAEGQEPVKWPLIEGTGKSQCLSWLKNTAKTGDIFASRSITAFFGFSFYFFLHGKSCSSSCLEKCYSIYCQPYCHET